MVRAQVRKHRALSPAFLVAAVLCVSGGLSPGAQVPDEAIVRAKPEGEEAQPARVGVLFRGEEEQVELRLPAPYWEMKTPEQLAAQAPGGGCAPGAKAPPGMLVILQNRDAQAAARADRMPGTFLMRNEDDLETYVAQWGEMLRARGGAQLEAGEFSHDEADGVFTHRFEFTAPMPAGGAMGGCAPRPASGTEGAKVRYIIADFFVRPAGEDARLYRISCSALEEDFARQKPDFRSFIDSFRFTGEVAARFFEPNASADRLPSVKQAGGASACGGPGLIVAVGIVLIVYFWFRSRSKPRGLLEP